jgi:hypothetical protein
MQNKCPISPREIIRRLKDIPEILEWSKNKYLEVEELTHMGLHHIYIDEYLKHTVFLLKSDLTSHVFIGDPLNAHEWRKYDKDYNIVVQKKMNEKDLQWKVYKDYILYKGYFFDPNYSSQTPHWGRIVQVEPFKEEITDQWIIKELKHLFQYHLEVLSNIIEIKDQFSEIYCKIQIKDDKIELLEAKGEFISSLIFLAVSAAVQKISKEEKRDFCLWADLPQVNWTNKHYTLFSFGFINWLNGIPPIPKIKDVVNMVKKEKIPMLDKPSNDIVRNIYSNLIL